MRSGECSLSKLRFAALARLSHEPCTLFRLRTCFLLGATLEFSELLIALTLLRFTRFSFQSLLRGKCLLGRLLLFGLDDEEDFFFLGLRLRASVLIVLCTGLLF